jgi:hypothetical protein
MSYSETDPIVAAIANRPERIRAGAARLDHDISAILSLREELGAAARELALKVALVLNRARNSVRNASSTDALILDFSRSLCEAAANLHRVQARFALGVFERSRNGRMSAVYHDALCVLSTAPDYSPAIMDPTPLFGASTCSSTGGGRAPGERAFSSWYEALKADRVMVSPLAQSQISAWVGDPMLFPQDSSGSIPGAMSAIAQGIEVPA